MSNGSGFLLDTHVFVWLVSGDKSIKQRKFLEQASLVGQLFVSAITCWEIGLLAERGKLKFGSPCIEWVEAALAAPGVSLLEISPRVAVEASYLPAFSHKDPADRILVASARCNNLTLATRDERILDYGSTGHIRVLKC